MVRYKKMLKVLLTALYFKHGSEVSRDDYGMYMIYAYLAVIRLDDLGASVFTKFILAQVCYFYLFRSCFFVGSVPAAARACGCWPSATQCAAGRPKNERVPRLHLQRANSKQVAQRRVVHALPSPMLQPITLMRATHPMIHCHTRRAGASFSTRTM